MKMTEADNKDEEHGLECDTSKMFVWLKWWRRETSNLKAKADNEDDRSLKLKWCRIGTGTYKGEDNCDPYKMLVWLKWCREQGLEYVENKKMVTLLKCLFGNTKWKLWHSEMSVWKAARHTWFGSGRAANMLVEVLISTMVWQSI